MIRILLFSSLVLAATACSSDQQAAQPNKSVGALEKQVGKQLNVSVLWDLSDRINPVKHTHLPSNAHRDIAIVTFFAELLKKDMEKKGAYLAKGKLKIFFSPNPSDTAINSLASQLDVDLSDKDIKLKKEIFDNISTDFARSAKLITDITIRKASWEGSDIFRFFKNDVINYCVAQDSSYRNILVIITDGYVYHPQSKGRIANKSEYILPALLSNLGLRNNADYKSSFTSKKCGLITTRNDLSDLEIVVLEVNSEENNKDDEDIIKLYLEQWFTDMGVKRFEIFNTDLPDNTKKNIAKFLNL